MVRTEIHIPTISNEGRPFGADAFKATEQEFLNEVGGFTKHEAEGQWMHDGVVYTDVQKIYTIDAEVKVADETIERIRKRFAQLELYVVTMTI